MGLCVTTVSPLDKVRPPETLVNSEKRGEQAQPEKTLIIAWFSSGATREFTGGLALVRPFSQSRCATGLRHAPLLAFLRVTD